HFVRGQGLKRGLVLRFVLIFALIAAPVYITLISNDYSPMRRLSRRGPDSIGYWLKADAGISGFVSAHLLPPLTHLVLTPDGSRFFYGGDTALILPVLVPFFLIGLAYTLRSLLRRSREVQGAWLLLLWLILTIA